MSQTDRPRETVGPRHGAYGPANEQGRRILKGLTPDFTSDQAAERWIDLRCPPLPEKGSGKDGGFTVKDVEAAGVQAEKRGVTIAPQDAPDPKTPPNTDEGSDDPATDEEE